jgi:hypothetical protein
LASFINHDPRASSGRDFDHGRPVSFQIEKGREIDRACIASEKQRIAVHQSVKDNCLMRLLLAKCNVSSTTSLEVGGRHSKKNHL